MFERDLSKRYIKFVHIITVRIDQYPYFAVSVSQGLVNPILAIPQYFCINKVYPTFLRILLVSTVLCCLSQILCNIPRDMKPSKQPPKTATKRQQIPFMQKRLTELICKPLILLASPSRFERPAPSLGGKCSIQLSYGDVNLVPHVYNRVVP